MINIRPLLRKPKLKGRKAIYFTVRYQNQTAILYPNMSVHSNDWVSKNGISKPRDIPENYYLKDQLYDYEKLIRETHLELQKKTPGVKVPADLLKKAVYAKKLTAEVTESLNANVPIKKENHVSIVDFFQTLINDSIGGKRKSQEGKHITSATIASYTTTKKHFEDYQALQRKKFCLSGINQQLIDGFADYLTHKLKMSFNSLGKYMKTFRTMMSYARQLKLIGSETMLDNKVKVTKESTYNIYLNANDIKDMWALTNFETPLYELVRDIFLFGCLTGLRYSDYSNMSKARIDDSFIYITQQKTQGRVTIPIHSIAKQILAKYPNGLPDAPPNQVFNRYLKVIGKMLPQLNTDFEKIITREGVPKSIIYKKYEILTSHSSRRSFATNEYLNGTPTITIMAITGHLSEKSFMSYIKADSMQHAMLLADRWKKNEEDQEL